MNENTKIVRQTISFTCSSHSSCIYYPKIHIIKLFHAKKIASHLNHTDYPLLSLSTHLQNSLETVNPRNRFNHSRGCKEIESNQFPCQPMKKISKGSEPLRNTMQLISKSCTFSE